MDNKIISRPTNIERRYDGMDKHNCLGSTLIYKSDKKNSSKKYFLDENGMVTDDEKYAEQYRENFYDRFWWIPCFISGIALLVTLFKF